MKISIVLAALTGNFETDMNRASKTAQKRLKEVEKTAKQVGKAVGVALSAAAGIAAVAIKQAIDRADELSKTAQKVGITTESLSTLSFAAQRADVDLGQLQGALTRLTKSQADAAAGNEKLAGVFDSLGVEIKNADGTLRDTGDVFRDISKVLDAMRDGATKTSIALDLMGKSGANLIPLTKDLEAVEQRARDLGLQVSEETGKAAEEFNDQLTDLRLAAVGLAGAVAEQLLPDLIRLNKELQDGAASGDGFTSTAENIANAIRGLAWVGGKAFDVMKLLALGIANVVAEMANFAATYGPLRLLVSDDQRQALRDIAVVTEAGARDAARSFAGLDTPGERSGAAIFAEGERAGAKLAEEAKAALKAADAEKAYAAAQAQRRAAERAAAEAAAAGRKASAEGARESAEATRRMQDQIREAERAQGDFLRTTEDLRAELGGPLAKVQLDYIRREDDLIALGKLAGLTAEELADSLGLLEAARVRDVDAIQAQIDADKAYQQAIADGPLIDQMDSLRDTTAGFFVDLVKNGKSAIDRLQDYLLTSALESIGKQIAEGLFGDFGTTGAGSKGSGFASIFGSLFGGAREFGGAVSPGKAYLVGEKRPELFIPSSAGTIVPSVEKAKAVGRRGGDTFVFSQAVSKQSIERFQIQQARRQRRATEEFA
jgi:hypothetical protein